MANRYWVGGTGTWNNTTTNWSATSGGAGGASVPTVADRVIFDNNSGGSGFIVTCDTKFSPSIYDITFTRTALPMVFRLANTDLSNSRSLTIQESWTNNSGSLLTCDCATITTTYAFPKVTFYTSVTPTLAKTIKTGNIQMGFGFVTGAVSGLSNPAIWTLLDNWVCINPNIVAFITDITAGQNATLALGSNAISCDTLYVYGTISSSGGTITATGSSLVASTGTNNIVWTAFPGTYVPGTVSGDLNIVVDYAGTSPTATIACQTLGQNINWSYINKGNALLWAQNSSGVYVSPTVKNLTFSSAYTGTVKRATNPYTTNYKQVYVYGNIYFGNAATYNQNGWIFKSAGTHTITTNGVDFNTPLSNSAFTVGESGDIFDPSCVFSITENNTRLGIITVNIGTFNTNNYNMTISALYATTADFKTINLGSSTITVNNVSATKLYLTGYTGLNAGTSTIVLSGANCWVYGGTLWNLVIAGAGPTTTGSVVRFINIVDINNNLSSTITVPYTIYVDPYTGPSSTLLLVNNFNISGTAGNLVSMNVYGGVGYFWTFIGSQNPTTNYLNISNSTVYCYDNPGNVYYAGYYSFDGGNNNGWRFTAPSSSGGILAFF
jgi:hypothetical protein